MRTLRTAVGYLVKCTMKDQFQEKSELRLTLNSVSGLVKLLIDTLGRSAILEIGVS